MDRDLSRRRLVGAVGAASVTFAGCLGVFSDDETDVRPDAGDGNGTESVQNDHDRSGNAARSWPAIETGEVVSDFESTAEWSAVTGDLESVSDAPSGTQAIAVESDEETAAMGLEIPRGLDLEGWDLSMAIRADAVDRIHVEVMAPERGDHLTSIRDVPDDHEGWLRLDFGYIQKHGDPDLSNVRRLNVVAVRPEEGPTRIVADDLRRTEAVDNGKAILALYGGHGSHLDLAAPRLADRGWAAAVAVDPGRIGGDGRMTAAQLRRLRDRGWDVCSYPASAGRFPELPDDRTRQVLVTARADLQELGFADGSRHLFVPGDRMDGATQAIVREHHESAFLFGASPTGAPPTGIHTTPLIWGPDLHGGVRRAINLCDQYRQLVVLRIPRIVEDEAEVDGNSMSLADFEHLLDHLEHRGLDVVTPSDVVDGTMAGDRDDESTADDLDGTVLEAGEHHAFEGSGAAESASFDLAEGIVTIEFSHDGESDLRVELLAAGGEGDDRALPTTDANPGSGESIVTIEAGTYRLAVEADGAWSIDLDQPAVHADDLAELPVDVSGTGSSFVGPLRTDGTVSVDATHDGTAQFIVDGHGADGRSEQLINRTGEFDSSRSYSAGGAVWLNVEADGNWTLEVGE